MSALSRLTRLDPAVVASMLDVLGAAMVASPKACTRAKKEEGKRRRAPRRPLETRIGKACFNCNCGPAFRLPSVPLAFCTAVRREPLRASARTAAAGIAQRTPDSGTALARIPTFTAGGLVRTYVLSRLESLQIYKEATAYMYKQASTSSVACLLVRSHRVCLQLLSPRWVASGPDWPSAAACCGTTTLLATVPYTWQR